MYEFHPMTPNDLSLVRRWLREPHVVQWWGNPDNQFDLIRADLDEPAMNQFIVAHETRPFAYLQCYGPGAWEIAGFGAQPAGTRGIDQFIGKAEMLYRGHGSAFIRSFIGGLLTAGSPRIITDPDPSNAAAIRAYERAGFKQNSLIETPGGRALLMVCDA